MGHFPDHLLKSSALHLGVLFCQAVPPDESFHTRIMFVDVSTSNKKPDVGKFWNKLYIRDTILFADGSISEVNETNETELKLKEMESLISLLVSI